MIITVSVDNDFVQNKLQSQFMVGFGLLEIQKEVNSMHKQPSCIRGAGLGEKLCNQRWSLK